MRKFTELALHNRKPNKTEKDGKAKWLIRWSWLERDRASEWVGGVGKDRVVEVAKRGGGGSGQRICSAVRINFEFNVKPQKRQRRSRSRCLCRRQRQRRRERAGAGSGGCHASKESIKFWPLRKHAPQNHLCASISSFVVLNSKLFRY